MDELIEVLNDAWRRLYADGDEYGVCDTISEAAAALEAAREAGWIACSDRLPERDGLGAVLAFDAARPRKGVWLETTHPSWWGQFMEDANEWGPTVTHWRPLPTPPAIDQARGIVPEAGQEVGK